MCENVGVCWFQTPETTFPRKDHLTYCKLQYCHQYAKCTVYLLKIEAAPAALAQQAVSQLFWTDLTDQVSEAEYQT